MLSCTSAPTGHNFSCGCGVGTAKFARRGFLALAGATVGAGLIGQQAHAASGNYEAMLVNCVDPRVATGSSAYMAANGMKDLYSHFVVAGGPIGAIDPRFASWHAAFWDNLDITIQLHKIKRVVALTHRDCGAAKLAFGDAAVATREAETASHGASLRAFTAEVRRRKPDLTVVAGIMDLNGSVQIIT